MEVTLHVIGGKWKPLILHDLQYQGPQRFSEIQRYLQTVPKKTLSQQLRELEADGIIARRVIPSTPVQVEYSVTPLGETLYPLLNLMCTWGVAHIDANTTLLHPTCSAGGKLLKKRLPECNPEKK